MLTVENRAGGPGAIELEDLTPDTTDRVDVRHQQQRGTRSRCRFRTVASPRGHELTRFATLSDMHFGARHFGLLKTIVEVPQPAEPHPIRCARSAIHEAERWGATSLIVKGDITDKGRVAEWQMANETLGKATVPLFAFAGNHDTGRHRDVEPPIGFDVRDAVWVDDVTVEDRPGLRLILVNTAMPGRSRGAISHRTDAVLTAAAESDRPVMVMTHQHLQRYRLAYYHPFGITKSESTYLLDALVRIGQPTMVSSGHSHRNRVRRHGPVTISEVASTKDYPGVWAGYVVHEGGVRQVVRRVAEPSALQWTEYTRRALAGAWAYWSPGRLTDRSFVVHWPR